MHRDKVVWFVAIIILLANFGTHIMLLSHYGINWDEPVHYMRGQVFLRYFLTGKKDYQDLPKLKSHFPKNDFTAVPTEFDFLDDSEFRRSIYQYDQESERLTFNYFITSPNEAAHPPLSDILASLSNYIFYQKLGVLGDIESYHLFIVIVSSLLVVAVFLFTASEYGVFPGIVASISLSLYPLFFGEQHFNIKDPIEASFYGITIITAYFALKNNKFWMLLLSSLFAGLAISTKFNILFAVFTILPWVVIYVWKKNKWKKWIFSRSMTVGFLLYPIIVAAILISTWPYLWSDPVNRLLMVIDYYKSIGGTFYQHPSMLIFGVINSYALLWILYATPIITLLLIVAGLLYVFRFGFKEKHLTALLVTLWLIVPIARVSVFRAGIYGGLRQIIEILPALAILAGIGAYHLVKIVSEKIPRTRFIFQIILVFLFVPITLKIISIHPNENVYLNSLIGGLKGAKMRNFPDWGITLGSAYQQGINWINVKAEPNANLALVKGLLSNVPRTKLRQDINFSEHYWSGMNKQGEYLIEVIDYDWPRTVSKEKLEYLDTLTPVYEVLVDGVAILTVWKNDLKHTNYSSQ